MSESLLSYLLKRFEACPEEKFYEIDLTRRSKSEFDSLRKQKYLIYDQYDFEQEEYVDKRGNEYFVRKVNGKWIATSTERSDIAPLKLTEQDLTRYAFSIQPLLDEIKSQNNLARSISTVSSCVWFVGEKTILQKSVGVFVALLSDDQQAEAELLGLKAKISKTDGCLILCPNYQIKSQNLFNQLAGQNILCLTFKEAFKKGRVIDFGKARFQVAGQQAPTLTTEQSQDYTAHGYKCFHRLDIPGTIPRKRSNELKVNDNIVKMPDEAFKLLMELVVELKKGKGGWVTKVVSAGKYQIFDRVRQPLQLGRDAINFIENDGSKRYRISTHPDFVTYNRVNLMKHPDATIKSLAKKLTEKRRKKT